MKYLGGKQRLGKHLSPVLMKLWDINQSNQMQSNQMQLQGYLEPFCGSLGVLKNMAPQIPPNMPIVANDYHPDLIQMWKEVKADTFIYPPSISEEEFLSAKALLSPSAHKSFVGFGMSFGGRFFGVYAHKYLNGKKEDFCKEMTHSLQKAKPLIQNVEFTNQSYLDLRPENMFIYCDPPYAFTKFPIKYRRDVKKYDKFDTPLVWETVRKWSVDKNNLVVVSELTAPPDFIEIWNLDRYRSACQSTKTRFKNIVVDSKEEEESTTKTEKLFIYSQTPYQYNITDIDITITI